ncbi:hypothetical protein [Polymorphobacter megasporae]|uniref:hypothetical protein n=1 Tax=Glacieibacterium megasporae TaxID=2835787 RepID=UPI001C1E680F|nr:hypothetical protein [Polymorphobacter megasporae]UAJ10681.1 hypothetical protein KTC28_02720 [Polymorphobacter megasporae]
MKNARFRAEPDTTKLAKLVSPEIANGRVSWRFCACDRKGPFAWGAGTDGEFRDLVDQLHSFEHLNWNDLMKGGSHPVKVNDLSKAARDQLRVINRDDIDELVSLRMSAKGRLWCVRIPNTIIMEVLWWDAKHQVYPVYKDKADQIKKRRQAS